MQLKRVVNSETLVIFFSTLITGYNCARQLSTTQSPEGEMTSNLDFLVLVEDHDRFMVELRGLIMEHYSEDDLYFIGNPLAWIGQLMRIENQYYDQPSTSRGSRGISFVPFTGNFFQINGTVFNPLNLNQQTRNHHNQPTEKELENYKILLRGLGLDPKSIVQRFVQTRRRTVLVTDIANMMSFVDVLFHWARLEGMHPERLRNALSVFVVSLDRSVPSQRSRITDEEYEVDMLYINVESMNDFIQRIGDPDRLRGYVRLVPNYPHQLWNNPPVALEPEQGRKDIMWRLTQIVKMYFEMSDISSNTNVTSVCQAPQNRRRRDLDSSDQMIKQLYLVSKLNSNALKSLEMEHSKSSMKTPFEEFFAEQLKNPSSTASAILDQACDIYRESRHYDNANRDSYVDEAADQVHFSPKKSLISWCVKRHRLFHCNENYEKTGIVKEIADLVGSEFSGKIKTRNDVAKVAEDLVQKLKYSYPKFPVEYLIGATREAALYCSEEKIVSTLVCPTNNIQDIVETMFAWMFKKIVKSCSEEIVGDN